MAATDTHNAPASLAAAGNTPTPPQGKRLRLPLKRLEHVRAEIARVYRLARAGQMDVSDASKLANILQVLGRLIESTDLEKRIAQLERDL